MQIHYKFQTLDGRSFQVPAKSGTVMRFGNGFRRERGVMALLDLDGSYFAYHLDTKSNTQRVGCFDSKQDFVGWFGYCPIAISLYREAAIPVRVVA